jgi:hypothetical protein
VYVRANDDTVAFGNDVEWLEAEASERLAQVPELLAESLRPVRPANAPTV